MRSLVVLALSVASIATAPAEASARPLRVQCDRPAALRLAKYEDGSARLYCARRELVRVNVPW